MKDDNKQTYTPMMQQYLKIKEDYADALVFFRLGDFYELFFDDAIIASKVLEIALTARDAGSKVSMAGVPHHSVKPYIQKLIENGYKIAIAEQVTEPGKGLVEREVTRVITPGTVFEDEILEANKNNFIASLLVTEHGYLLTYADISTGESFLVDKLNKKEVIDQIKTLAIKELVVKNQYDTILIEELKSNGIYVTIHEEVNTHDTKWNEHLELNQRQGARHLLNYLNATQKQPLSHLQKIVVEENKKYMNVDFRVKKHLEIIESNTNNQKTTLLYHIDNTKTAMGARLLKHQLNHPLIDLNQINQRLDLITAFLPSQYRSELQERLSYIYDINRIVGKVSFKSVNARDLYQLRETLKQIEPLKETLYKYDNELINNLTNKLDNHQELIDLLEKAISDNPPLTIKEGGIIKTGHNEKLDELHNINAHSKEWLQNFEEEERERTGIKTLKVGYNRVFGYFIEISKAASLAMEEDFGYERKQTLTNSERYISPILKEKEDVILNAKDKAINLEYELFVEIRDEVTKYTYSLQELSGYIASIDVYLSHAISAEKNKYVRPTFNNLREVKIIKGRHPVVEKFTNFVANDIIMSEGETFLITGPNMSGKSTYMRMFALLSYMSQVGSFVPATSASLPIYDAIFTRIGSSDDLSGGKSTFMVEMVESNEALTYATNNSLILFDEIGRGTATYDGMALAQGMVEYIYTKIKAQMLFSTHYHELTALADNYEKITNLHVKAREEKNRMIFLHQVEKGASDKSYGLQVAALANLPKELIKRSEQILKQLENKEDKVKVDLFNYDDEEIIIDNTLSIEQEEVLDGLERIDFDKVTPIDALILLKNYQNKLKK
ncbi:DNA mismatch repair protein MutS [Haploplasma axanthum]|uniref:DNA mismatch repair protein MutS n=1 Tax=Haploplasma axanthum TaxID=29552 RepID=A0A449BE22_HAPAX|nr:DNA mismatch repair protein MutS [Haploplasma axanthum]VEU80686.1 DNA mismatch repair protein mutS [Haploplasma axanthum]